VTDNLFQTCGNNKQIVRERRVKSDKQQRKVSTENDLQICVSSEDMSSVM